MKHSIQKILLAVLAIISYSSNSISQSNHTQLYFCTAADAKYFSSLIYLIASIHATNFDSLSEIAVFDLGLKPYQKAQLKQIERVKVYQLETKNPDVLTQIVTSPGGKQVPGSYAFKAIALKQSLDMFPYVLWLDAGSAVMKPLDDLFEHIVQNGSAILTIGDEKGADGKFLHTAGWGMTKFVRDAFDIESPDKEWILDKESIMGGIIGIAKNSRVYRELLMPLYEMTNDLRYFNDDGTAPNGFGTGRHDQPLLSILAYSQNIPVLEQDHTQKEPIYLNVNNQKIPLFITWNPSFVDERTAIYSSRGDTSKRSYMSELRYKKPAAIESVSMKPHEEWWSKNIETYFSWNPNLDMPSNRAARNHIQSKKYDSLLDAACGLCPDYLGLPENITYYAIDITPQIIEHALSQGVPNAQVASIEKIPYPDSFVDLCYARHILEHLDEYKTAITELIRVAKREVLIVFFIKPDNRPEEKSLAHFNGSLLYHNKYSKKDLEDFIGQFEKVANIDWEESADNNILLHIYLN